MHDQDLHAGRYLDQNHSAQQQRRRRGDLGPGHRRESGDFVRCVPVHRLDAVGAKESGKIRGHSLRGIPVRRNWIVAAVAVLSFAVAGIAQGTTYRKGTTAAAFLKIEVDPRAVGMGGAYVSLASGASAGFWNPSGLAFLPAPQMSFQSSQLYAGLRQTFLAAGSSFGPRLAVGLYVNHLNLGGFEETTLEKPDGTGRSFTARNVAVAGVVASQLTDHVAVGASLKFVEERIWYETSRNVAVDLGTTYRFTDVGIRVGMLLSNLGPNSVMDQGSQLLFR
ncbi:MAG TPA: PorV/PorQ family protein, partial [Bacteroidetes bacterium]|nr:PorV/PorQ family protein [Bacteroidota bacterium]